MAYPYEDKKCKQCGCELKDVHFRQIYCANCKKERSRAHARIYHHEVVRGIPKKKRARICADCGVVMRGAHGQNEAV